MEELEKEESKYTEKYEADNDNLRLVRTPSEIIPQTRNYNIKEIRAEIEKIDKAIAQWEAKKAPLQEIVNTTFVSLGS